MINSEWYKNEQFILTTQAKQVFYLENPSRNKNRKVVEEVNHRKIWDHPSIDDDNEVDVVHDSTSSNFILSGIRRFGGYALRETWSHRHNWKNVSMYFGCG